jgi:hypothetical protein
MNANMLESRKKERKKEGKVCQLRWKSVSGDEKLRVNILKQNKLQFKLFPHIYHSRSCSSKLSMFAQLASRNTKADELLNIFQIYRTILMTIMRV